jgi:myo-inositol-1(or 4)-monophosphatase
MDADIAERFTYAKDLVTNAGQLALDYWRRIGALAVSLKGVQDLVSDADVAVEKLIKDALHDRYPSDAFLGEETGHADFPGSTGIWVVDPIDGTQPFLSGLPSWCISVAYLRADVIHFGAVYNPTAGELFSGGLAAPALLNDRPIHPHPGQALTDGLTFLGCSPRITSDQIVPVLDRLMRAGGMYFRHGSGALGLCDVACGRLIGYVEPHLNSWDCLGAIAVLKAAGAQVSDFLAGDGLLRGNPVVAGPPAVYPALVDVLG